MCVSSIRLCVLNGHSYLALANNIFVLLVFKISQAVISELL